MKESEQWKLPNDKEYYVWSKEKLLQTVGKDKALNDYLVEDNHYQINQNTLALYEFQKKPLFGRYKSVIFDCHDGIVLSPNSSRSLFTTFSKKRLLAGLEFQRDFGQKINLRGHNVIATGRLAFFSMRSYNSGNVDWVALHQMSTFESLGIAKIAFKTVPHSTFSWIFVFDDCSRYIGERVGQSLFYNHALYQIMVAHFECALGWQAKKVRGKSLIDQPEYFHPHQSLQGLSLKEILVELLNKKQLRYGHYLASFYEFPELVEFHRAVEKCSQRPDTLF